MSGGARLGAAIDRICAVIADEGCAVESDFLPRSTIDALRCDAHARDDDGEFRAAGVGRGTEHALRDDVRGDRILWLDQSAGVPVETPAWEVLDALRLALNRSLQLGLFSVEAHYAIYPPGAAYRRHLDRFRAGAEHRDVRVISFALYLNQDWTTADGGVLRIYDGKRVRDVLPVASTLACFLSDRFEHEVLPAARQRLSLTGWFRRRA